MDLHGEAGDGEGAAEYGVAVGGGGGGGVDGFDGGEGVGAGEVVGGVGAGGDCCGGW